MVLFVRRPNQMTFKTWLQLALVRRRCHEHAPTFCLEQLSLEQFSLREELSMNFWNGSLLHNCSPPHERCLR